MPNLFSLLWGNRFCRALFTTVLVCLDHVSLLVMWKPRNLKLSTCTNGGVLGPPFPVVHNHLRCLNQVEDEVVVLAPHGKVSDLLPIDCLFVVGEQAYHCWVIGKLNDGVGVMLGCAVMGEQGVQEGPEYPPLRGPVVRTSVAYVLLPTLSTWGWLIRQPNFYIFSTNWYFDQSFQIFSHQIFFKAYLIDQKTKQ